MFNNATKIEVLANTAEGVFYTLEMLREKLNLTNELDPDRSIQSILTLAANSAQEINIELVAIISNLAQPNNFIPTPTPLQLGDTFTIGTRIQIARENLGMSKAALANKLDLTPECIADWEEETCPVEATYIIPLATALKCDPMWLLTGHPVDVKPAPLPVPNVMKGADLANIGVRIESRRNEMGMSPLKLAEEIDTSGAMILEWEAGKAIPHSDYIDRLAKALNTTVTWLMTGKHITA